jgi:glycosyltransferase involved in cell wall biosynthesis
MPLFSVVIWTYNRSGQLDGALRSVLAQDVGDYELLVVDDSSSDNTADVVAAFDSPHIRYLRRPNGGLSVARNAGIAKARGEFVILLDDDRVDRPWLSTLASKVRLRAGVVSCGCRFFFTPDTEWYVMPLVHPEGFGGVTAAFLAGAFAVRRELYETVEGYAEELPTSHQTELALRMTPEMERQGMTAASADVALVHIEHRAVNERIWSSTDMFDGGTYIVDRHHRQLARWPQVLADCHAVAAVSAFHVGDRSPSRRQFRRAVRARPRVRHVARHAPLHVPPLVGRVCGRHRPVVT